MMNTAKNIETGFCVLPAQAAFSLGDCPTVGGMELEVGKLYTQREVKVCTVRECSTVAASLMNTAANCCAWWREWVPSAPWYRDGCEHFVVACLNRKNRLEDWGMVSVGTATAALAHPREVFRLAVVCGASVIVCFHNHPSGDPAPSAPDLHVTRQLREASRALDIDFTDHVIVGEARHDPIGRGYFSFREAGML